MSDRPTGRAFQLVGEHLCLDFVNTEVIESGSREDLLGSFDDLMAWCAATQMMTASQAREMTLRWRGRPDAERALERAVRFRKMLRGMVERLASGRSRVPQAALDTINDVLRARAGDLTVVRTNEGYQTRFRARFSEPSDILVPVAESAADLLSTGDLTLIKKCQNPACILYFYDTTKNRARRWCSMAGCGNRAKVAAHYRRTRQGTSPS